MSDFVGIGHNSRIAELEAENARLTLHARTVENENFVLRRKIERADLREHYYSAILDSDRGADTKVVGIRLVKAANEDGMAQLSNKLLRDTASVDDDRTIRRIVKELEDLRLIRTERSPGVTNKMHLLPLEDIQSAVAAYRAQKEAQPPTSHAGGPLTSHVGGQAEPLTSHVGGTCHVGGTSDVGGLTPNPLHPMQGDSLHPMRGVDKVSPPLVPPLFPHTPFFCICISISNCISICISYICL